MTLKIGLMLVFSTLINCTPKQSSTVSIDTKTQIEGLKAQEFPEIESKSDSLGEIISTIEFKVKTSGEDLKIFTDSMIPWISLENPVKQIENLLDADKVILPYRLVSVIIDYPLNNPATFEFSSKTEGFSRKQLILEISKKYHDIYTFEEKSARTKTIPIGRREGLINRNQTDGKYGVWGHDLSDLDLSSIEVYKNSKGKIFLTLVIES